MSWKTACLLVNLGGRGYLAGLPLHDGNRARDLLPDLGLVSSPHSRFATLEAGLSPPDGYYCLGAYPKALVVAGLDDLYGAVERPQRPLVERCLARFPRAETLLVELAGGVGLASFALWSEGRLQRAFAADDARGVVLDEGEPLPEEAAWTGASASEVAHHGESRVFAVCARALGAPLDTFEAERLSVELMSVPSAGLGGALRRLFGRTR